MAQIKVLYINDDGLPQEHSEAADSIKVSSVLTANHELTDSALGSLIGSGDANDIHIHDARYFRENEHINTTTGVTDAGKPIVTNASGVLDGSFFDPGVIDHGQLNAASLLDDDHTQYILVDGTRAFTGDQSLGGFKITNLADGVAAQDAVTVSQLQAVEAGLDGKDPCRVATTSALPAYTAAGSGVGKTLTANANGSINTGGIDGITSLAVNDRVMVKNEAGTQGSEGAHVDHGMYKITQLGDAGTPWVLTRAEDFDGAPSGEVQKGSYAFILEGTSNNNTGWRVNTDDPITVDTTAIQFSQFQGLPQYTASLGVELVGNDFRADLLAGGGIKTVGNELSVEPNDFAGAGLVDDGADNMAIDWSTAFNDAKAVKAQDLASVANGFGASIIGVEDAGGYYVGADIEAVLQEVGDKLDDQGQDYTVGTGGVTIGDLVYLSAANTVVPYSTLTAAHRGIGIALTTEVATSTVRVLANDTKISGLTIAGTPVVGDPIYWDGTQLTDTIPGTPGSHVWQAGVLADTGVMHVEVRFVKKN